MTAGARFDFSRPSCSLALGPIIRAEGGRTILVDFLNRNSRAPLGATESSPAEPVLSLPKETAGLVAGAREQSRQGRMNNSSCACFIKVALAQPSLTGFYRLVQVYRAAPAGLLLGHP